MELLDKLNKIHNNHYTYNINQISNSLRKDYIDITCPKHGNFKSTLKNHLKGRGCPACGNIKKGLSKKKNAFKNFVEKSNQIHGNLYDYSKVNYTGVKDEVVIVCSFHGDFLQTPDVHLRGSGCPECGKVKSAEKRKITFEEFKRRSKELHGDKYTYTTIDGVENKTEIICPIHGSFFQIASLHMTGSGCPLCSNKRASEKMRITFEEFKNRAEKKFNNKFQYKYHNKTEAKITCPVHGEFIWGFKAHLRSKEGCKDCIVPKLYSTTEEFIKKARKIHGDKYSYEKSIYSGAVKNTIITCKKHGDFYQTAYNHINLKCGCPSCRSPISKPQQIIVDKLKELNVEFIANDRKLINPYELDILIPSKNIAIEVNGLWYHSSKYKNKNYHNEKFLQCEKKGVKLLQFWDSDIKEKESLVLNMVLANIGIFKSIHGRKTEVKILTSKEYSNFMEVNHIQGKVNSSIKLGLLYHNEIVAAMGLTKINGVVHLQRFANLSGYRVLGGFTKLLKQVKEKPIVSFSDNFYSDGHLYQKSGFILERENSPRLHYTNGLNLFNRMNFQKPVLRKKGYDTDNFTEKEIAESMGFYQIFGGGTKKWVLK